MEKFQVIVIGGGPGGYLAAERAAGGGLKTAVFEKANLGGVCLNEGCIPTKTLLNCAKHYRYAVESAGLGVTVEGAKFDHAQVIERKKKVVKTLVGGVGATMKAHKVTVIKSEAKISGKTADGFKVVDAEGKEYFADKLVIATGSSVAVPPVEGLKEGLASGFVKTNREILDETKLPENLVVIGGGVIGLEMACYFASVGTKVTVIEMMDKIAGATDADICKVLMNEYGKRGMDFRLSCRVKKVNADSVTFEENGKDVTVKCDSVLLSAGRRANTANIGLETIGVETERGAIITDRHMCTNVPGVYAVGDCNGKVMLAHTAYREAEVAVNNMLGKKDVMRYECISSVIYTDPEVASVGESKASAEKKGMKVKEVKLPMSYAGRYVAETENGAGFCKLVYDTEKDRLVGVHMVGSYASEMIYGAALMMETELPLEQLKKLVFPHPTVCEVIREGLFML